eukprot:scaffold117955_cov99-Phaeocystis_antarctica.AAC.1
MARLNRDRTILSREVRPTRGFHDADMSESARASTLPDVGIAEARGRGGVENPQGRAHLARAVPGLPSAHSRIASAEWAPASEVHRLMIVVGGSLTCHVEGVSQTVYLAVSAE